MTKYDPPVEEVELLHGASYCLCPRFKRGKQDTVSVDRLILRKIDRLSENIGA